MRYVITGSTGHISKPLSLQLIKAGNDVTIVTSNANKVKEIEALGAKAAVGSIEDVAFLTKTFKGADAVYTMVPPKWDAADWKGYIHNMGKNYVQALEAAGVKKVVNLSSIGAHMPTGCGPVSGIHFVEKELNAIKGIDIKHLRPGFFYYNLLANIGLIKHAGIIGGNYGTTPLVLVHPTDIAAAAAEELLGLKFTGTSIRYVASDERPTAEIAKVLGKAIGKPELPWVNFTNDESLNGMLGAGLSKEVAENYTEMGAAVASGEMFSDYYKHKPALSPIKLEDFAKEFAAAYANS
jgi:uncharacterized protein YbjT (DUF2867 family)